MANWRERWTLGWHLLYEENKKMKIEFRTNIMSKCGAKTMIRCKYPTIKLTSVVGGLVLQMRDLVGGFVVEGYWWEGVCGK